MNILIKDILINLKNYSNQQAANTVLNWLHEYNITSLKASIYDKQRLLKDLPIHAHFVNNRNAKNFGFEETIKSLNNLLEKNVIFCSCCTNSFSIALYLDCNSFDVVGLIGIYQNRDIEKDRLQMLKLANGEL